MEVQRLVVGQLRTNCYLAFCSKTGKGVVIDPGDEGDFISEKILQFQIKPLYIIATHGHFDHILAAEELRLNFNIPFLLHQKDAFLMERAAKETQLPPKIRKFIKEGEKIEFGQEELKVIHTPGHTPGSITLFNRSEEIIFSGDLIFPSGVGRTDFSYSSLKDLKTSLKKILSLPPQTLVYPGHGEEFILESLKI